MSLLPSPLKTGDVFKSSAVRAINALIEYCRTHEIRGDNRTVQVNQTPSGVMLSVILRPGSGQGAGAGIYNGPFAVTYDSEAKKLKIKKGFRNVNGEFAEVPDGEAEAAEGTLCLHMEKDAETGELCEPKRESSANRLSALPCPPPRIFRSRALKVPEKHGGSRNTMSASQFSSLQENAFMQ